MLEKLLEYQEIDGKLRAIELEISNSDEYKNYQSTKKFLAKAPEKLELLDKKAESYKTQLTGLNKKYIELCENVKDFDSLDDLLESGADVSFYKKNVANIAEELKNIKAEIKKLSEAIKASFEEYSKLKKETIKNQKEHREWKEKFEEKKKSCSQERDAIIKELNKVAKVLGQEVVDKYNAKRGEKIFPVVCEVKDDRCGKCGMDLSVSAKSELKAGELVECESCQRFLYIKK